MEIWRSVLAEPRMRHRVVLALYVASAAFVTVQRGILSHTHTTFRIFRQSFWHLVGGLDLYAYYPAEQGGAAADLFKYSPTAALLFGPFAIPPYAIALFAWSLLNAFALYYALRRLLPAREATLAALLLGPDLFAALQACSSNGVVAALIVLAFVTLERDHQLRGATAIVAATALKIFPLSALTFATFHPRRRRFVGYVTLVTLAALLLPLLVTSPRMLAQQYHWWLGLELSDARDLAFGDSVMHLARRWTGTTFPNWPLQLAGTVLLLLPLVVRRDRWPDAGFRRLFLASLLAYAVLFNHQAERASFVIGSTGVAIWYLGAARTRPRTTFAALALVGLKTLPLLVVWLLIQGELYGPPIRLASRRREAADTRPAETTVAR